jgi:hypothetical protein
VGYGIRVKSLGPLVTEWYQASVSAVSSVAGRAGDVILTHVDITDWATALNGYAPINSPSFTGTPSGPTPAPASNSTQLATTAFVATGYAPINSPSFTGVPVAVTAMAGTNSTQLATTAFVANALGASVAGVSSFNTRTGAVVLSLADVTTAFPAGAALPLMDGVAAAGAASSWSRSDHKHPTDTSLVPLSGGAMTGPLTLSGAPVNPNDAATKAYADGIYVDMGTY